MNKRLRISAFIWRRVMLGKYPNPIHLFRMSRLFRDIEPMFNRQ
jgi:hypothetical protein